MDERTRKEFDRGKKAAEQFSRAAEEFVPAGNAVAQSLQRISQDWIDFSWQHTQRSLDAMNRLAACRTPQELVEVQAEFWRDSIESLAQSGRKLSDQLSGLSTQIAEESARTMAEKDRRAA